MAESSRTSDITPGASHTSAANVSTVDSGTDSANTTVSVTAVPLKSSSYVYFVDDLLSLGYCP